MIQLENTKYRVGISELGAEIQSIYSLEENFDYIWNDNWLGFWKRHAPILFPAIGRSYNNAYLLNNDIYEMPQHGFGRDQRFMVTNQSHKKVVFELENNEKTEELYPFDFKLIVAYELKAAVVRVTFTVLNLGDKPLPFALGAHPGFNVPFNNEGNYSDYRISFDPVQEKLKKFGIAPIPFRNGEVIPLNESQDNTIPLSHHLFDKGLIILANQGIKNVILSSSKTTHLIKITLRDFPYVALWSLEKEKAPFLCIEPFAGLPDIYGNEHDIFQKEGNTILGVNGEKTLSYQIALN